MKAKADLAASVAARLLNRARKTGDEHQSLLTSYCLERFLYRLGASDRRDRFVLKGAMLLRVWSDQPYRATGDLDLLRRGDGAADAIRDDRVRSPRHLSSLTASLSTAPGSVLSRFVRRTSTPAPGPRCPLGPERRD